MFDRTKLMWHSMRYTSLEQLVHRARLLVKRRIMVALHQAGPVGAAHRVMDSALAHPLPTATFQPRTQLVARVGKDTFLLMLNRHDRLEVPFAWQPEALAMGTYLERLNFHYMEFLEALDDARFVAVIDDWIRANPCYAAGYWRDSWNSYALSIRVVVWMQQYACRAPALPPAFCARMLCSLEEQLEFLRRNVESDIGGNHIIKNIKALLWGAAFLAGPKSSSWQSSGQALLARELPRQILRDGMHFERSPAYHAQVFGDLLECRTVLGPGRLRDTLDDALARMATALAKLVHPDGKISLFNDGGLGMTYQPGELLGAYARVLRRAVAPTDGPIELGDAGYFGARSKNAYVLFDCGAIAPDHLPAHGHGDILAFEWSVGHQRIVVDQGVFEYHPGSLRDISRATASHNTVTLDGRDQCEFWKAFRVGRRGRGRLISFDMEGDHFDVSGWHDGYRPLAGAPIHTRRIRGTVDSFVVEDRVTGGAGQLVEARLLLHPDCSVEPSAEGLIVRAGGLYVRVGSPVTPRLEEAQWFPDFGVRVPSRRLVFRYGRAPCDGRFSLSLMRA